MLRTLRTALLTPRPTTRCNFDASFTEALAFQEAAGIPAASFFALPESAMRFLILAAGAALTLAACRNNDQHDTSQNADENLTAESIVSNDVTAIDAVTADAANMAADVDYSNFENEVAANDTNSAAPATTKAPRPNREPTPRPKPTTETASNSTD
jgi:hypothetical protein